MAFLDVEAVALALAVVVGGMAVDLSPNRRAHSFLTRVRRTSFIIFPFALRSNSSII